MSLLEVEYRNFPPFEQIDPLERLAVFFQANGYQKESSSTGLRPESWLAREDEDVDESAERDDATEADEPVAVDEAAAVDQRAEADQSAEVDEVEDSNPEEAGQTQVIRKMRLTRGKDGAGWWTSNLTELKTTLEIRGEEDRIVCAYQVDVRGQRLNNQEREFWKKECNKAFEFLSRSQDISPVDLRKEQAGHADRIRRRSLTVGTYAAVFAFLIIAIVQLLRYF